MRRSTHYVTLLGFCGFLLLGLGCGGSSEPAATSDASSAAGNSSAPAESGSGEAGSGDSASGSGGAGGSYAGSGGSSYGGEGYGGESYGGEGYGEEGMGESGYGSESYGSESYAGETGYGGGGYGYGGGSRSGSGGLFGRFSSNLMGKMTPAVSQIANPAKMSGGPPPSFLKRAAAAFAAGNEALARDYYLAHMVGEYDEAGQAFSETQFSSILKRPAWAIQWGVSVHVRLSGDGDQEIHPVKDDMPSPLGSLAAGRGRRGAGGGGYGGSSESGASESGYGSEGEYGSGYGGEGYSGEEGAGAAMGYGRGPGGGARAPLPSSVDLSEQLGLVATVTGEMFGERLRNGNYGSAFGVYQRETAKAKETPQPLGPNANRMTGNAGYGDAGYGNAGYGQAGNNQRGYGEVSSATGEYAGEASATAMSGGAYSVQINRGGYGGEPGSGGYGSEGYSGEAGNAYGMEPGSGYGMQSGRGMMGNRRAGQPAVTVPSVPAPALPRWRPGIVFVGNMNSTEALAKAQEHTLDFLIHFDVAVRTSQTGAAKNITRARVYDVAEGDSIVISKAIDNFEIYKLAQAEQKTERESVEEVLGKLFEVIDDKLTMRPMPKLSAQIARARAISLVESAGQDPLRTLAEIRLYQYQQAIDIDQVAGAFHMAAGDEAVTILYGLPETQRERLEEMIGAGP